MVTVMQSDKKVCFVISPIGSSGSDERSRADQVLKHIITPAASKYEYTVIRADTISQPGLITTDIIQYILDVPLVIADLTNHNPNVFYELAIRHAIRKPIIQIIASGQYIPFDISQSRTISFDLHSLDSVDECREAITKQIYAIEHNAQEYDNPISTAIDLQVLKRSENPQEKSTAEIMSLLQAIYSKISNPSPETMELHRLISGAEIIPSSVFKLLTKTPEEIDSMLQSSLPKTSRIDVLLWMEEKGLVTKIDQLHKQLSLKFPNCTFSFFTDPTYPDFTLIDSSDLIILIYANGKASFTGFNLITANGLLKYKTYLVRGVNDALNYSSLPASLEQILPDHTATIASDDPEKIFALVGRTITAALLALYSHG
jgi:hypothetical protein